MHTVGYFYIRNLFFVQALRLHPELDGCPFWIERSGKVLAHSPCLERDGLHPGLSARRARRIAPQAHRLEYRPEDYRGTHELFCHIAHRFTPVVEPLNPGEIFLGLQGPDTQTAQALVAEARDLGFEATVAIAGSRLTARWALMFKGGQEGGSAAGTASRPHIKAYLTSPRRRYVVNPVPEGPHPTQAGTVTPRTLTRWAK